MQSCTFPGCCSAVIVYGFGGGHEGQRESHTKQQVIQWMKRFLKNDIHALVFAIPTSTQPNATAALEEMGFYTCPDYKLCGINKKSGHKMHPFFIPRNEWNEKEFNERYNPDTDPYENKGNYGSDPMVEARRLR